ncbi:MAG: AAA domain-containing protein [Chloroflexi bacterium]|nr:AAA domain-containing protein [Chloroflexota bacterium]
MVTTARKRLVSEAIDSWKRQLIDLGGRNTLLYFRDLRRGTLDLSPVTETDDGVQHSLLPPVEDASRPAGQNLSRLLSGRPVRLSQLFADPDAQRDAARRARAIRAKARENDEERGLETLYLAYGLATWTSERSTATPNAPALLYRLSLTPIGATAEDFTLQTNDEPEANEALLHLLETDFNLTLDADELLADVESGPTARENVLRSFEDACASVRGFSITPRAVVGNFSYAKLPMVRDLERAEEEIATHTLLAAVAGDTGARDELRGRHAVIDWDSLPASPAPEDEFLVLDADSSQSRIIAAAVAGGDMVMIGPPGTGKSQTIANLIATLAARGKSVLFVAEKRAAIEAVIKRLHQQELGDLLLDLHDGGSNRRRLAGELGRTLASNREALAPDTRQLHRGLNNARTRLESYADQLHAPAEPWGVSAFDAQRRLLEIGDQAATTVRLRGRVLERVTRAVAEQAMEDLQRFVELNGPAVLQEGKNRLNDTYTAKRITDEAAVTSVLETLADLRHDALPVLHETAQELRGDTDLAEPATLGDVRTLIDMGERLNKLLEDCRPDVLTLALDEVASALAPAAGGLARTFATLFRGGYRQARSAMREHALAPEPHDRDLLALARLARDLSAMWRRASANGRLPERALTGVDAVAAASDRLTSLLDRLDEATGSPVDREHPLDRIASDLDDLDRERAMLMRFPELHRLEEALRRRGLGPVLDEVCGRDASPEAAAAILECAWLASILDRISIGQPALAQFDADALTAAGRQFRDADRDHIAIGKDRVKRAWAEAAVRSRDAFPDQAGLVSKQASLKRRHMPIRTLFDGAHDVLTAVKPCWVMSPLAVAQVLPAHPCFDVVIFDEASQIPPADAVSSLLRGRQAVVAGDPHQLPPTAFFVSGAEAEEQDQDGEEETDELTGEEQAAVLTGQQLALTADQESVLDVMRALLPPPYGSRTLAWHYRSLDERLITFSNAQESLYDWSLTTFPGALHDEPLHHVIVPFRAGAARVTNSVPDEVARVVDLIIDHARARPEESLGVIALGSAHADAISEALRLARGEHEDVAEFFEEDQDEPPFVKNLERVQGDERDAIILTTGYGKQTDGRMRYQFGPLTQQGGERRLNVAVTRARRRMTVVSSFTGEEMDPERLRSDGAKMLRDYLLYSASGGADLGVRAVEKPVLNAFERDVQERLEAAGVRVVPQYGASGYWIDFAAMHPDHPSRPVLAIEADGASYHSSPTARDRDRLRQEHLERLGWCFHRIWSTEWFRSREAEVDRAVGAWRRAVRGDGDDTADGGEIEDDPAATPDSQTAPAPRGRWPGRIVRGLSGKDYSHADLREVVRWVKSDGRLHTEEELLDEVLAALRFQRRGPRITPAIRAAIEAERVDERSGEDPGQGLGSRPASRRAGKRQSRRRRR